MNNLLETQESLLKMFGLEGRHITSIRLECVTQSFPMLYTEEEVLGLPLPRRKAYELKLVSKARRFKRRNKIKRPRGMLQ